MSTKEAIESFVVERSGARRISGQSILQNLWSGYGTITRFEVEGAMVPSVIVKHVAPPAASNHPRGWDTDLSHQRKLHSYEVETAWYREYASACLDFCRVPRCFGGRAEGNEFILVLEDLDAAGFPRRETDVSRSDMLNCIRWIAEFHATFLGGDYEALWSSGSYWHLETRPDELKVLAREDPALHAVASEVDACLKASPFQTLVHGDAKLANFCFSEFKSNVAAVDFQYVGRGCGMKDLAYFVGSCLCEEECESEEGRILDFYFRALRIALRRLRKSVDFEALEANWRGLYPYAWTDFHRFLKGWSPGHWKINGYSERLSREVIDSITKGV